MDLTLCLLFYGDHPRLAERCLAGVEACLPDPALAEIRVALANVSTASLAVIGPALPRLAALGPAVHRFDVVADREGVYPKYPAMRRLFGRYPAAPNGMGVSLRGASGRVAPLFGEPLASGGVVWSDDDSFPRDPRPGGLYTPVARLLESHDVVGERWYGTPTEARWAFYEDPASCPWAAGVPRPADGRLAFPTGGWWAARVDTVVERWDWPSVRLRHRGGDSLLGDLIRQQGLRWADTRRPEHDLGMAVNAGWDGRSSGMPTRGFREPPLGDRGPGDDRWSY